DMDTSHPLCCGIRVTVCRGVQGAEVASSGGDLLRAALVDDAPVLDPDDDVTVCDVVRVMTDDERRTSLREPRQCGRQRAGAGRVDAGQRLVEHHDAGFP